MFPHLQLGVLCHGDQQHPLGEDVGPGRDLGLGGRRPGADSQDALVDASFGGNEQHLLLLCGPGPDDGLVLQYEPLVGQAVHL